MREDERAVENAEDPAKPQRQRFRQLTTINYQLSTINLCMSLDDDRNWAAKIYRERAETIDADRNVTYFFLEKGQIRSQPYMRRWLRLKGSS